MGQVLYDMGMETMLVSFQHCTAYVMRVELVWASQRARIENSALDAFRLTIYQSSYYTVLKKGPPVIIFTHTESIEANQVFLETLLKSSL